MLLEINKNLLRNQLRTKSRLESIQCTQSINFIDWFYGIIDGSIQDQTEKLESSNSQQRSERRSFMIRNFDNLVKKKQLIELLFYVSLLNAQNSKDQSQNQVVVQIKKNQSPQIRYNYASQAENLLIDIISYNERLNKDLYQIIESNSQLGQTYLNPSHFTFLYQLIVEIDKKTYLHNKNNLNQYGKCWQFFIDQLSFWWSINKDYLITTKYSYLRYNLLAYFIENAQKEMYMSFQNGILISRITSGIQKRLIEPKYHKSAVLIWTKYAKLLDLDTEISIQQKAQYFVFKQLSISSIKENKFQQKTQKKQSNTQTIQQEPQILNASQLEKQNNIRYENLEQENEYNSLQQEQFVQFKVKAPQTLQDCILALHNPLRRQIGLKKLKKLIKKQQEDLIFVWKSLLKCILHPLIQQSGQILKQLLIKRPKQWIQDISQMFFKKDSSVNDKVILIECIEAGVNQLSQNPNKNLQETEEKGDFYFKRVTSKYFTEKPTIEPKPQPQSRRWGHTRIVYEEKMSKKSQSIKSLLIIGNNDPYMNRLYPIITQLFFKIIIKLLPESQKSYLTNPLLTQRILNLLGSVANNIKNYFEKYLILEQILIIVERILSYIQSQSQRQKKSSPIINSQLNWNQKSVSTIVISNIQVLNKIVLSIDKYLPQLMLVNLKDCVQKLKKIDIYGIRPLVEMLEMNIFNKIN